MSVVPWDVASTSRAGRSSSTATVDVCAETIAAVCSVAVADSPGAEAGSEADESDAVSVTADAATDAAAATRLDFRLKKHTSVTLRSTACSAASKRRSRRDRFRSSTAFAPRSLPDDRSSAPGRPKGAVALSSEAVTSQGGVSRETRLPKRGVVILGTLQFSSSPGSGVPRGAMQRHSRTRRGALLPGPLEAPSQAHRTPPVAAEPARFLPPVPSGPVAVVEPCRLRMA
ncbi:hypothetical protein J2S48_002825 [Promicromonospora iranensis]|uniref:Uncharacterized protein n=1 Tax=Promicromonospora iranensis TaxID=1105144 RepID=A0ABU2CPQ6_9MICO|nr:hypothetical protein [Promicromonospora iranensis]